MRKCYHSAHKYKFEKNKKFLFVKFDDVWYVNSSFGVYENGRTWAESYKKHFVSKIYHLCAESENKLKFSIFFLIFS